MILDLTTADMEGADWKDSENCPVVRCVRRTTEFNGATCGWRFLKLSMAHLPIELPPRLIRWIADGAAGRRVRPYREQLKVGME